MIKGCKTALLALTALSLCAPAMAQERGGWGGRGNGGAESGGMQGGGRESRGGWQGQSGGSDRGGWQGNGQDGPGGTGGWQRGNDRNGGPGMGWSGNGAPPPQAQQPAAPPQGGPQGWQGGDNRPPRYGNNGGPRPDDRGGWNQRDNRWSGNNDWNRGPNGGPNGGYVRPAPGRPAPGYRVAPTERWQGQSRWDRDWRSDNRYDWWRYRQYNRGAYRLPAYRAPPGWGYGYSRFSIGVYLGGPLFGSSYWIDDPYSYRLPPAYGTLRWIRYYDDALLVDIRDGYVVDVIHDFFW